MKGEHPWLIAGALLVVLATPALGTAPEVSLRPEPRGEEVPGPKLSFGAATEGAGAAEREAGTARPDGPIGGATPEAAKGSTEGATEGSAEDEAPDGGAVAPLPPPLYETVADDPEARAACLRDLAEAGAEFTALPAVDSDENRDCGILFPIEVTALAPGVALSPPAVMRCETALAASVWMREWLLPAAAKIPELGELRALRHGSAYVCRARSSGAKLSEHALGNALDIMALEFEDSVLEISPRAGAGDRQEAFQRTIRAAACLEFTTVIGPGTDEAHADHLHLDVKRRNRGYRLCQ